MGGLGGSRSIPKGYKTRPHPHIFTYIPTIPNEPLFGNFLGD